MIDLVAGRLEAEHIADKTALALDPRLRQHFIEQLPAAPDERMAKPRFLGARCLANQHQPAPTRRGIAGNHTRRCGDRGRAEGVSEEVEDREA